MEIYNIKKKLVREYELITFIQIPKQRKKKFLFPLQYAIFFHSWFYDFYYINQFRHSMYFRIFIPMMRQIFFNNKSIKMVTNILVIKANLCQCQSILDTKKQPGRWTWHWWFTYDWWFICVLLISIIVTGLREEEVADQVHLKVWRFRAKQKPSVLCL